MPDTATPDWKTLDQPALEQLFLKARTYNAFSGEVDEALLRRLYDTFKLALGLE